MCLIYRAKTFKINEHFLKLSQHEIGTTIIFFKKKFIGTLVRNIKTKLSKYNKT